jgi:hypothetical protein
MAKYYGFNKCGTAGLKVDIVYNKDTRKIHKLLFTSGYFVGGKFKASFMGPADFIGADTKARVPVSKNGKFRYEFSISVIEGKITKTKAFGKSEFGGRMLRRGGGSSAPCRKWSAKLVTN